VKAEHEGLARDRMEAREQWFQSAFLHEWQDLIVTGIRLLKDFAIFVVVWFGFRGLHWMTESYPIPGGGGEALERVHVASVVFAYLVLSAAFTWDMIEARLKRRRP